MGVYLSHLWELNAKVPACCFSARGPVVMALPSGGGAKEGQGGRLPKGRGQWKEH